MRLNGWQRLWIVSLVAWTLVVEALAYASWPTTDSIQPDEVYARMPRSTTWALRDAGQANPFVPQEGPIIDIDSHRVEFLAGVPDDKMTTTVNAYSAALHEALRAKRYRDARTWFVMWAVPAVAMYLAGWAIGWARRGFTPSQPASLTGKQERIDH